MIFNNCRDAWTCQFCGRKPPPDEITVDHVVPKSQGGKTVFTNTVLACVECNKKKDSRTPEQAGMKLCRTIRKKDGTVQRTYYHRPKKPTWSPLYAMHRQSLPTSWHAFLKHMVDELYWNIELEP